MAATAAANIEAQMAVTKEAAKELKAAVDALRQEWHAANAPQFEGGGNCPVCGQPLPDSEVAKARQAFEKGKAEKLAAITARGKDAAGRFEETKATLEHLAADLAARRKEAADAEQFAALAQSELRAVPEAESGLPDVEQTPEYCALYNSIQCAEGNAKRAPGLAQSNAGLVEKLRAEETKAAAGLAACDSLRKQHGTRIEYQGIIAELEERALELGQLIADAEKDEFTMAQYTKARVAECERKINGLFSEVSFRLYNTTIDGGEVETCEALVRGVPYSVANSAGKIAAGLDIITALQKFHGVAAPIFIDGAESVNKFPPMLSQMILLTVSEDPELVITSQR